MRLLDWLRAWWRHREPTDITIRRESLARLANPPRGTLGWARRHNYADDRFGKISPRPWTPPYERMNES
jgi:hypothetical protein